MAKVCVFDREEFITERFDYRAGEHCTFIGRTQSGKTQLAFDLLEQVASRDLRAVVLVMKPRDSTPAKYTKRIGLKRVPSWPPPGYVIDQRRDLPGWTVWPKLGNMDQDPETLRAVFRAAMRESYGQAAKRRRQDRIIMADEVVGIAKELGLEKELNALWMRGSSLGVGLWAATQRPFHAPVSMYNAANHLFLAHEPDKRSVQRFREIGGIDPQLVDRVVSKLLPYQFLYIARKDYTLCVIDR